MGDVRRTERHGEGLQREDGSYELDLTARIQ